MTFHGGKWVDCCASTGVDLQRRVLQDIGQRRIIQVVRPSAARPRQKRPALLHVGRQSPGSNLKRYRSQSLEQRDLPQGKRMRGIIPTYQPTSVEVSFLEAAGLMLASATREILTKAEVQPPPPALPEPEVAEPTLDGDAEPSNMRGDDDGQPTSIIRDDEEDRDQGAGGCECECSQHVW